jgi:hypothetical protein
MIKPVAAKYSRRIAFGWKSGFKPSPCNEDPSPRMQVSGCATYNAIVKEPGFATPLSRCVFGTCYEL